MRLGRRCDAPSWCILTVVAPLYAPKGSTKIDMGAHAQLHAARNIAISCAFVKRCCAVVLRARRTVPSSYVRL